ncbi:glycoside hydrolase family 16 protein [Asticcacaulis solisilvae]|uniref:glycoside hydrolase family 16 protein n=1 Tax=Asticcacaulis solisilvae TaxID=1217274 RepID=UPI003FD7E614
MSVKPSVTSRRGFLGAAGASLAVPFLSACGGETGGSAITPQVSATTAPRIVATGAATASSASSSSGASVSTSALTTAIAATQARLAATTWTEAIGPALDLTGFIKTFDSGFSVPDSLRQITVNGAGGPWYAPIHATSGAARFASPLEKVSPFAIVNRSLRIRCEQVDGAWQTGHMQTCDYAGSGFSQRRGYFEIRCKLPVKGTLGAWPAFWLYSKTFFTDTTRPKAEIDVIEYYPGNDPRGHHSTIHLRPAAKPPANALLVSPWSAGCYSTVPTLGDGNWHTHGVMITDQWIIIYYDRVEYKRIPLQPEFDTPMFMLVSLQLLFDEAAVATGPIDMFVDYVKVWRKP